MTKTISFSFQTNNPRFIDTPSEINFTSIVKLFWELSRKTMYVIKNLKCPSYFTLLCGWPFIFHVSFLPSCFYLKQSTETAFVKSFLVFSWLCCCSASKPCLTLCDLMDCSTLGLPVFDYLPVFPQTLVPWIHLQCGRPWFDSWVRKIHWRRVRIPTPVFLGFPCGSDGKESSCNAGDLGSIHEWEDPLEKGKATL